MEKDFIRRESEHYDYPQLCKYQDKTGAFSLKNKELNEKETAMYIHVPFCKTFCVFCNYYKIRTRISDEIISQYENAILTEIDFYSKREDIPKRISCVHFGGGTPSVLPSRVLDSIITKIKDCFIVDDNCEMSMEGNIRDLSVKDYTDGLADVGINRISFGVQTLQSDIRKRYGLHSDISIIYNSYNNLIHAGINNCNVDIMYGFPEQNPNEVISDIEEMIGLGVNCIDLYALNVFPNTDLYKKFKFEDKLKIYKDSENLKKYYSVYEYFYNNVNFVMSNTISSRTTDACKYLKIHLGNNMIDGGNVIGIGPSAKGNIGRYHYKNHVSFEDYLKQVSISRNGINLYDEISEQEAIRRVLVLFPNFNYLNREVIKLEETDQILIDQLIENEYISVNEHEYRLTCKGMFYAGNISSLFYSSEQKQKMTRSTIYNMSNKVNFYNQDK